MADFADVYRFGRSLNQWNPFHSMMPDYVYDAGWLVSGGTAMEQKQESQSVQIGYDEYMKAGNERAYNDWQKLYGSKGLSIRYPELSYPGAIAGYDAGISRAYISSDIAGTEYASSLPYRGAGLYGIAGRAVRTL